MNSTERAFSETIRTILPQDAKVVVAFSGGCDSLALLCLCVRTLGAERVLPVYVNHRLRSAAELAAELELNRSNCSTLGLELKVRTLDEGQVADLAAERGGGIEDAARHLRYQVLEEERVLGGASFILTAHHRQDQVETILMRLAKGSPVTSLRGISEKDASRRLLRPLLGFRRCELESYLRDSGFNWSTDSTNADSSFSRNNIRNNVIPRIRAIVPDFDNCILDLGDQAGRLGSDYPGDLGSAVDISIFRDRSPVYRTMVLFSMWDSVFSAKELPQSLVDRVLEAVECGVDCSVGSSGAVFSIYRGSLYLHDPRTDSVFEGFTAHVDPRAKVLLSLPGGMTLLCGSDIDPASLPIDEARALKLDPDMFSGPVSVRFAKVGDRIVLKDGAKMVLRLLQDMRIPAHLRCRVPILEDQEGVCAVFGSVFGGRDRICRKFITSLARNEFPLYIVTKG